MSDGSSADGVAVVIPARNEADRIQATVSAAARLDGVDLVVVVDDGSTDGTGAVARRAGAPVMRHARNRGKSAAMETGAEAVRLLDQREHRDVPRHLLFLDADLADTAAMAGPSSRPPATACRDTAAMTGLDSRSRLTPIGASPSGATRLPRSVPIAVRSAPEQNVPPSDRK